MLILVIYFNQDDMDDINMVVGYDSNFVPLEGIKNLVEALGDDGLFFLFFQFRLTC